LQHVQNAATRLVTGTRQYECGLSRLMHDDLLYTTACSQLLLMVLLTPPARGPTQPRQTDTEDRTLSKTTNADVKVNDVVLVHMSDSLTDLTQPTDALHFTVLLHLNGSCQ